MTILGSETLGHAIDAADCHPESKSLAPDGAQCSASTRGLLKRASITAGTPHYVGKETDRRWEQGEDMSLVSFTPVEYSPIGKMATADQPLLTEMAKYPLREMMRKTGLSQHTLEAIRCGQLVRSRTLAILKQALRDV
jgi:hypothetical protein